MTTFETTPGTEKQVVFSESIWEPQMGYARGVRRGNHVFVAGTVAADGNGRTQGEDVYTQTIYVIRKIEATLQQLGARVDDVVSTITHLADFADFDDYAKAFKQFFGDITPVNTTVQVRLVRPEFLVEITATALLAD